MRHFRVSLVIVFNCLITSLGAFQCGVRKLNVNRVIVHGQPTFPGEWPWHAAVYHRSGVSDSYACGGSLISELFVLTADHCVKGDNGFVLSTRRIFVRVGVHNFQDPDPQTFQQHRIQQIHHYEESTNLKNDVALLELSTKVLFTNYVQPVCVNQVEDLTKQYGTAIGWGVTEYNEESPVLKSSQMPVVSTVQCLESNDGVFRQVLDSSNFCAGYLNGTTVCNGDSGGGLHFERNGVWYVGGIIAFTTPRASSNNCETKSYAGFTNVYRFISWIRTVTSLQYLYNISSQDGDFVTLATSKEHGSYMEKIKEKETEEVNFTIPPFSNQIHSYAFENRSQNIAVKMANHGNYTERRKEEQTEEVNLSTPSLPNQNPFYAFENQSHNIDAKMPNLGSYADRRKDDKKEEDFFTIPPLPIQNPFYDPEEPRQNINAKMHNLGNYTERRKDDKKEEEPGSEVDTARELNLDLLPSTTCGRYIQNRIVGGQNASLMEFPWMALLGYVGSAGTDFYCMGTLISARYVLTGAYCLHVNGPILVRLGEHTIGPDKDCNVNEASDCAPPVQDLDIEYIVRHQSYNRRQNQNDIALIRLKEEVTFEDHIQPVCLPVTSELRTNSPAEYIIAGWGRSEPFGGVTKTLQKATVPAVPDRDECQRTFGESGRVNITDGHLCAGELGGADTCNGDGGGPLGYPAQLNGIRFVQYGIASFGHVCGQGPSVYTNIAKYIDWIVANMEP